MMPFLFAPLLHSRTRMAHRFLYPFLPRSNAINLPKRSLMRSLGVAVLLLQPVMATAEQERSMTPEAVQEARRPVISEIVTADPTRQRDFPGIVQAEVDVALAFQTSGRLATLEIEPGERVERGQALARLDQLTLEEDVAAARAGLEAAQAEADLAQQNLTRAQGLFSRGVTTEAQVEQAQAERDATAAQVEAARADLAQAEEVSQYGVLTSPQNGVVLSTDIETGTMVSAGTTILTLADPSRREATIDVPADFARVLPPEARFLVSHASDGVRPVPAYLRLVEPLADPNLRTRRLRLTLDSPPADYRIGSLVTATYATDGAPLMSLPISAIIEVDGVRGVWRVTPETRSVEFVPIELGAETGNRVIVTQSINVGDEIVTRGVLSLDAGQVVGKRVQ